MTKYFKPNNSTILYLNSSFNCVKSSSLSLAITSGGSGYTSAPTITISPAAGDMGYGCSATAALTGGAITSLTNLKNGQNYNTLPTVSLSGGGNPGAITGYTGLVGGSGYLAAPTVSASGGGGSGFAAVATVVSGAITALTITNGGSNYTSVPTIVFTPTNGGTGASATATVALGTPAVITPSFLKTFSYTWTVPDITINDLAKISCINIIATNFALSTPYTYILLELQYDSRDSCFSDYGNPILSMAQNTNVCSYGSLGGESFSIILQPQTIKQIQISVDDDITKQNSGQSANINFVIALEIEEYDPNFTQVGDVYGEAANRLKPMY